MSRDTPPVLAARDLERRFERGRGISDVSLDLYGGEVLALLGAEGAGKTTVVRILAGAMRPGKGTIHLDGRLLPPMNPGDGARHGIAAALQDIDLVPRLDAVANIVMGREPMKRVAGVLPIIDENRAREEALRLLAAVGITLSRPELSRPVAKLSGGQRQAVSVARAIGARARALLLDEPTAALGITARATLSATLTHERQAGRAILITSHDVDWALGLADRVMVLRDGIPVLAGLASTADRDEIERLCRPPRPTAIADLAPMTSTSSS